MKRSDNIDLLSAALAKAQAVMEGAAKDSNNPFFRSKYADLASCWAAWRPAGPPNGLALLQFATASEERLDPPIEVQADDNRKAKTIHFIQRVSVETLLSHESGQWVSETLTVLVKDDSPQSTILGETYARRGGLCAVIGIAPEDDDGNAAAAHGADSGERRTFQPKRNGKKQEAGQIAAEHGMTTGDKVEPPPSRYEPALEALGKYTKVSELVKFAEYVKDSRIKKFLTPEQYSELDSITAAKACEFPTNEMGFEAAEKLLRALHHELRITEGDYLQFCTKLADAKDAKLGEVA
ncbi:MAG: ERF family protein [Verrucomicrobiales bacterium]|nr:ERF family protein [Verrucomicrobiales bacterium]